VKDAEERLLDLLSAWATHADAESAIADFAGKPKPDDESQAPADLYQLSAQVEPMTDADISAFVINKLLPVILTGKIPQ
jgi:hypothetical protein